MSAQYVYTMHRLTKAYPPDKTVLNEITLAFLPGAKIGVLGYNGAGKSTLLKIMAGIETDFRGDAMLAPNATVGLLEQEPQLDDSKDVRGNVEQGIAGTRALLDRFNELAANYSDETADEFAASSSKRSSRPRISASPSSAFPRTSFSGFSCGSCSSRPTVAPGASCASPSNSRSTPARIFSSVDLPAPL